MTESDGDATEIPTLRRAAFPVSEKYSYALLYFAFSSPRALTLNKISCFGMDTTSMSHLVLARLYVRQQDVVFFAQNGIEQKSSNVFVVIITV